MHLSLGFNFYSGFDLMNFPPFHPFPELQTEKILLREAKSADAPALLEVLTYDGKVAETEEEGIQIISKIHQNYLDGETVNWVIEYLPTNEPIGFVGYYRGFPNNTGELGCILKQAFRGKGLMAISLRLAADFGLHTMNLDHVIAITQQANSKAIALLERTNFEQIEELPEEQLKFRFTPSV